MVTPIRVSRRGHTLTILMDDGSVLTAHRDALDSYLVGGLLVPPNPDPDPDPDPEPGSGWKWPFPESAITPGREWGPEHNGLDFGYAPALSGAAIGSIGPGTVVANSWEPHGFGGGGFVVIIDHGLIGGTPWFSSYNHMDYAGPVTIGQSVVAGTHVGDVGNSGFSFGAHLHLQIQTVMPWSATTYDPRVFLDNQGATGK